MEPRESLEELLRTAAGDLAALTGEQADRLEQALNADPALAARLGDQAALPRGPLAQVLAVADRAARPDAADWQRVWAGIEAAGAAGVERPRDRQARIVRLWKPLAAAAACLVLSATWRMATVPARVEDPWPLRLATDVVIDELEAPDGTPFVFQTGRNGGRVEVIWLLESPS